METMRDVLRDSLGKSLRGIGAEDRLAAAWTVAGGKAMASHGSVVGYEAGVMRIEVSDAVWLGQMVSMRSALTREIARIADLPVKGMEFELKAGSRRGRR